ncbi:MAG: exodeoxyribonuclease VII large subunit [Anaeromyxobacteraceae bacterium]
MSARRRGAPDAGATGDLFAPREPARPAEPPAPPPAHPERRAREAGPESRDPPRAAEPPAPPPPPRAELAKPLTVGELTRALKNAVEPKFRSVWVAGEITNLRRQSSGHVYFALKDDDATINAVAWASTARRFGWKPEDGQEVLARGFVEIYAPHGKYQLIVDDLEPRGAGAHALLVQQVKARLQADGLLDPAKKRPLPFLPRRIGVATSPTGAAVRDFLRVVHARFPSLPVLVAPCRVQGEGAAATVVQAVRALCRAGVDVIVVTRGGGSPDELAAFDDERLARAIAACPVPVVSAVGHETDVTVADLVADLRAATPTHAAQLVAPVRDELLAEVAGLRARLERALLGGIASRRAELRALKAELADPAQLLSHGRHRLDDLSHRAAAAVRVPLRRERARLEALRPRLLRQEPRRRLTELRRRVEAAARRMGAWQAQAFRREELRLERLAARLEPANVAKLLSRGFALVLDRGHLVARSAAVNEGDPVRIALAEGWLDARVEARDRGEDPLPGRGPPGGTADPRSPVDPGGKRR